MRPSMKLIVAGAVSSPCTRAQVAPLCSNFHLTPLTAQQRGLASAHSARLAFFRSRRVSAPLRPARTGDEPVRTPRRARRQAKRVLQGDGGFPQGCDARRAAVVTVPTISVPVNDRFVPWNARSSDPRRPFPDHETTPNRDSFTQRRWRRAARPGEPWTASSPPATSQPRRPNDEAGRTIRVTRAEWWRRRLADEPIRTSRPRFPIGSRVYAPRKRSRR